MIEFFQEGGPFMWPLALWSVLSLAFFLERVYTTPNFAQRMN